MKDFFDNKEQDFKALNRLKDIKSFYTHLGSYTALNIGLLIFKLAEVVKLPETFWHTTFVITAGLGALGVLAHWATVWGYKLLLPKHWEERKIKQFIDRENNKQ